VVDSYLDVTVATACYSDLATPAVLQKLKGCVTEQSGNSQEGPVNC